MNIGPAIRSARKNVGLSVKELATMVGVQQSVINQIERGRLAVSFHLTQKIVRVLGLDINKLATIAVAILEPDNEIKKLQSRLLLAVQPILLQSKKFR